MRGGWIWGADAGQVRMVNPPAQIAAGIWVVLRV
jgi:hypothetical protein